MVATIGENMSLRRARRLQVGAGVVASYVHNALAPGLGKIGVLVALESTGPELALMQLGRQLAMHVAAANPQAVDAAGVDPKALDREREVLRSRPRASGKPEAILDKMVEGRLRKFYEEVVLLEQVYVIDGERRVKDAIAAAAKEMGAAVAVTGFARFALGEGIDREHNDFAAEGGSPSGTLNVHGGRGIRMRPGAAGARLIRAPAIRAPAAGHLAVTPIVMGEDDGCSRPGRCQAPHGQRARDVAQGVRGPEDRTGVGQLARTRWWSRPTARPCHWRRWRRSACPSRA